MKVTARLSKLVSLGNYENLRVEVGIELDVEQDVDVVPSDMNLAIAIGGATDTHEIARAWCRQELAKAIGDAVPPEHPEASPKRRAAYQERRNAEKRERAAQRKAREDAFTAAELQRRDCEECRSRLDATPPGHAPAFCPEHQASYEALRAEFASEDRYGADDDLPF